MRYAIAAAFTALALVAPAAAQDLDIPPARIPTLPARVLNLDGLIPAGWKMEKKGVADLNGDGITDAVMVVRGADPKLVISNSNLGPSSFNSNPRMLVIGLGNKGGGYRVVVQNSTLITRHELANMEDPFDAPNGGGLTVKGRAVKVDVAKFMNAGGWGMFRASYTFRWQNNRFELIGYDSTSVQRNTGVMRLVSINYSTGKVKVSTGHISDDRLKEEWKSLPDRRRLSIDEIGDGLDFDSGFNG